LASFAFFIAADGADHGRAEMLRPLAEDEADAPCCGMQQDGIAGFDAIGLADQILHRQALEHHGGRGLVIDPFGQFQQTIGRNQPRFGIGAKRSIAVGDAVARLQIADAGSDFFDHAGALAAQPARQLGWIQA
jgi:hypothetical protein